VWNAWRKQHPEMRRLDLSYTDFGGKDSLRVNRDIFLSYTDLSNANLYHADLSYADLSYAKLSNTDLRYANLSNANLSNADLSYSILYGTNLSSANLNNADLSHTTVRFIQFNNIDLRTVRGLDTVQHTGPSYIGIDTIYRSEGHIPETFLRKAGVPEDFIIYMRSLVTIEYYTCFISYSSHDQEFANQLYTDLQSKGVRCWFAPEDMKTGDKIRQRIDESIRLNDKLLLVLSEHSIASSWVEFEVEAALAKEDEKHALVLFPVRLDDAVMQCTTSWAAHIKRMRHITNFTDWKHHDDYQKALTRLFRDLKATTQPKESTT